MGCSDSKLGINLKENDNIENNSGNSKEIFKEDAEKLEKIDISDESDSSNKEKKNKATGKFF